MDDKVIVITGGASGMGYETAKLLASKGARVSLADVQADKLEEVEKDIEKSGGKVMVTVVDVRKRDQVEDWIKKTVEEFGKLDGAANLAGVIGKHINITPIEDVDDDDWDFVMGVNAKGILNCMRAQIPHFNSGGSIVNASSVAGIMGMKRNASYVASKHAVVGLTRTAAKELGPKNIRCNCFCPYVPALDLLDTDADFSIVDPLRLRCFDSQLASEVGKWTCLISLLGVRASHQRWRTWWNGYCRSGLPSSLAVYRSSTEVGCVRSICCLYKATNIVIEGCTTDNQPCFRI